MKRTTAWTVAGVMLALLLAGCSGDEKPPATGIEPKGPPKTPGTKRAGGVPRSRTWASADGKFRVEAELVKMVAGVVHLKRKDGQVIQVPIDKLGEEDRKLLRKR